MTEKVYRSIRVRTSLLTALEMRSTQRLRGRGRKTSCRRIFTKDNVNSLIIINMY